MAAETVVRQWWVILRRDGFVVSRTKLRTVLVQDGADLNYLINNISITPDFDILDDDSVLPSADQKYVASYELVGITQPWEINEVD